ncbi:MAG: glycosyltransferase family 39 protein [Solirubrobacteraceae bacterium]
MAPPRAVRALLVAIVLIAALAIRVTYVQDTSFRAINDAGTYNRLASMVARTGDYDTGSRPGSGAGGSRGPTAYFPPGFPYFLAAVDVLTGHPAGHKQAVPSERIAQALLGTVAVGLIGLVALEAFGGAVALACLALAAVYPVLVELSGTLVAENLMIVLELAAVWTTLRTRRARHPYVWIAAAGVLTGLATLTHQNAIVLLIPFAFVAWTAARPRPNRTRSRLRTLAAPTTLLIITGATIAPWTIRNAIELHRLIPVSDETGITLVGTYNPDSAAFAPLPYKWRFFWKISSDQRLRRTAGRYSEAALGSKLESRAIGYVEAHPLAPLQVAGRNTARMFELAGPYAWQASAAAIELPDGVARVGVFAFWALCALALLGAFTSAARIAPRWLWSVPVLLALTVVFVNVETPRFREPIEPFLVMLAGCAVASGLRRLGLRGAPVRRGRGAPRVVGGGELVEMVQRLP